jgi:hypothetical protein
MFALLATMVIQFIYMHHDHGPFAASFPGPLLTGWIRVP